MRGLVSEPIARFLKKKNKKVRNESRGTEIIDASAVCWRKMARRKNNLSVNLSFHSYNNFKNEVSYWRSNHRALKILLASLQPNA